MIKHDRSIARLVALFLLATLLLLPPMLLVFNRPVRVLGIPLLFFYLFAVWVGMIGLTAMIVRHIWPEPGGSVPLDAEPAVETGQEDARRAA